jgi:hypothetical protein
VGDGNNRAEVLESLRGLLAVVEAIPEEDCPRLYVTNSAGGGWTIQVTKDGSNGSELARRLQVARIAGVAGLKVPEDAPRSVHGNDGRFQVYTGLDETPVAEAAHAEHDAEQSQDESDG